MRIARDDRNEMKMITRMKRKAERVSMGVGMTERLGIGNSRLAMIFKENVSASEYESRTKLTVKTGKKNRNAGAAVFAIARLKREARGRAFSGSRQRRGLVGMGRCRTRIWSVSARCRMKNAVEPGIGTAGRDNMNAQKARRGGMATIDHDRMARDSDRITMNISRRP